MLLGLLLAGFHSLICTFTHSAHSHTASLAYVNLDIHICKIHVHMHLLHWHAFTHTLLHIHSHKYINACVHIACVYSSMHKAACIGILLHLYTYTYPLCGKIGPPTMVRIVIILWYTSLDIFIIFQKIVSAIEVAFLGP